MMDRGVVKDLSEKHHIQATDNAPMRFGVNYVVANCWVQY